MPTPYKKIIMILALMLISLYTVGCLHSAERHERRIGERWDLIEYSDPNWAPDGKRIIYFKRIIHYKRIYVGPISSFANISPNKILSTDHYLCTINIDGTDEKIIKRIFDKKRSKIKDTNASWSLANDLLVYSVCDPSKYHAAKYRYGYDPEKSEYKEWEGIFVIRPDGTLVRKVANEGENPRWSPDGTKIKYNVYKRWVDPDTEKWVYEDTIWIVNADGTDRRRLVNNARGGIWHPDGKRIFYYSKGEKKGKNNSGTYLINLDGMGRRLIIRSFPSDRSPDTTEIIDRYGDIYNINSGKKVKELGWFLDFPRWSPDGEKFVGNADHMKEDGICIIHKDGTGLRLLLRNKEIKH